MGPKNHFEPPLCPDDNPQDVPSNPNTNAIATETVSAEHTRNGVGSDLQAMSINRSEDIEEPTNGTAQKPSADGDTPKGHRRSLKFRALVPVFACYVCYNAGKCALCL